MHYVVATDGSTVSDEAVTYAAEQAAAMDVTLEIVHVIAPETRFVDGELVQPSEAELLDDGGGVLDRARALATDTADVTVETELLTGRPADAIAEHATDTGAAAIYVGHRGLSEKREQVVGSVAKSVLDRATLPVTVVR
ncbi:MAG: universal stress protein UspA related nucleotide-binding protein [halophilic archaeon J07HX64]|jgi:Universal stress protein UspA and related nucleotide-binding proteins|nr:MAG: universal stress protein UspA related nucleotide-binding protein [halophilic archaeon J07HX64]